MLSWIRRNKLSVLLAAILLYLLFRSPISPISSSLRNTSEGMRGISGMSADMYQTDSSLKAGGTTILPPVPEAAPQADVQNRMVVQDSYLSLLVKNVSDVRRQIVEHAQQVGGYMVTTEISNPQDQPTGSVVVRIPTDKLDITLEHFRSLSIKIVTESLNGHDVTDQYVDVEKRIAILETTKARFEDILSQAREISDITNLNREIISVQSQIDQLRGQQEALKQNAALTKVTVYLSTDELALPYAPSDAFRPGVIFKQAVRSLVGFVRELFTAGIWMGVYSVVLVPVLVIGWFLYRKFRKS